MEKRIMHFETNVTMLVTCNVVYSSCSLIRRHKRKERKQKKKKTKYYASEGSGFC